ncbi:hypothetical protein CYMTET_32117 [Cymbomonas tetramitiformis]|uniref:Uncharacterized protein n=1 Tax=Cymbomonas tetramitiformis TaxID=36881 RepID=A0AAE0KS95_9CHLO|nr:hypothetical protein CYMTET_32117 [Cymbomonas tetramitiformis]
MGDRVALHLPVCKEQLEKRRQQMLKTQGVKDDERKEHSRESLREQILQEQLEEKRQQAQKREEKSKQRARAHNVHTDKDEL